jgi:protocatechuate 3,4-dioxygenase beta subunit
MASTVTQNRRLFMTTLAAGAATFSAIARAEEQCTTLPAPPQPEGPFYPLAAQADMGADLTKVTGHQRRARGEIVELVVKVQDADCKPIANARVDAWQACATGRYNHPDDPNTAALDPDFQYFAIVRTDANGEVALRTVKPGAYRASATWVRPPHIHFKVSAPGFELLTTQMYFAGEALNVDDEYIRVLSEEDAAALIVDFQAKDDVSFPRGTFVVTLLPARG